MFKPNKKINTTAKVAPEIFPKTSKTSACLVVVKSSWAISIPIPKKTENRNETITGFTPTKVLARLLKYKKQSNVSTK